MMRVDVLVIHETTITCPGGWRGHSHPGETPATVAQRARAWLDNDR